jgi:hypothetical protein
VIVMVDEPAGVVVEVVTVSVEDEPPVELGLNVADAPAGAPLELSATVPVNPPVRLMLIVYVVEFPAKTVWLAGEALRLKPGPAEAPVVMAKFRVVHCA